MYTRIEVTNLCNLKCRMCPQSLDYQREKGFIDPSLFFSIIDQISPENKGSTVSFHISGEPLLHPDIIPFINYTESCGLSTDLVTNATLLKTSLRTKILDSRLSKICFSFEGINKKIYESIRVGAVFEEVQDNIFSFLSENKSRSRQIQTELVVVLLEETPESLLKEFRDRMTSRFDKVNFSGYFDWLGKTTPLSFSRQSYQGCSVLSTDLNILCDGRVIPCCMDVSGALAFGDFRKQTYKEIISSPERKNLETKLLTGDIRDLACFNCYVPWGGRRKHL